MTAAVFTFVLLFVNVLREMLPLLISQNATLGIIARAFGLLVPFVWVYALPMGMLTATLLVFGRFSADQELTAARASGVSLMSLIAPILTLSLVLCAISAVVNLEVAPRCRVAYNNLRFGLKEVVLSNLQLPEGRPIYDFPGYIVYVGKIRKQELEKVFLYKVRNETNLEWTVRAPTGRLEIDRTNQALVLHLFNSTFMDGSSGVPITGAARYPLSLNDSQKARGKPGISDMTFAELQENLREAERRTSLPLASPPASDKASPENPAGKIRALQKQRSDITEPIRVQIHRRVALSFACFGFTLVGVPLGIRMHRRETNAGVAIALGLVAIYYGLIVVAEALSNRPELAPHLLIWLPNFLFQAVGAVLLWRANRGES